MAEEEKDETTDEEEKEEDSGDDSGGEGDDEGKEKEGEIDPEEITPETRQKIEEKKKEEEEGETDPEDEKMIGKVVDKRLDQVTKDLRDTKDQMEVDSFIRSKPEFGKYREVALKYMKSPAYNNIPAHNIMAMVASKDLQKLGAQKEREAAENAKNTQSPGSTARKPTGGKTDWSKATREDIDAKKAEIFDRR